MRELFFNLNPTAFATVLFMFYKPWVVIAASIVLYVFIETVRRKA